LPTQDSRLPNGPAVKSVKCRSARTCRVRAISACRRRDAGALNKAAWEALKARSHSGAARGGLQGHEHSGRRL